MIEFNPNCTCGKKHISTIDKIILGKNVLPRLSDVLHEYNCRKPFVVADENTLSAAGNAVKTVLDDNGFECALHVFSFKELHCDESAIGSALMHFDISCDAVIGVGSGTINDICKIISNTTGKPYIIICTAPSMDGYASATSSAICDNLKVSLQSRCPDVIIGDTDIVKTAPDDMLRAGLGDMLAKYISICEWRIGHIVTGEYYCEEVAGIIRKSLKACVDNAEGLMKREDKAVEAVLNGLINGGLAMAYAGVSRPASGVEHYFSHVWDMRGVEFGTCTSLHGIQCGIATLYAASLYEKLQKITPDLNKALKFAESFDLPKHRQMLIDFLGESGKTMIELDKKEQKFAVYKHNERINTIIKNWGSILNIIKEEIPPTEEIEKILDTVEAPKSVSDIGIDEKELSNTFVATMDIRDKYVLSRLTWDLGVLDCFENAF
ncbi:MAG: sn-glycerol-1-phosphate dehydrogenase [Clostridia bacterium]|nr:sn-glycerol-1-phosphate dehydrogenase [Clostridia bacterium]